jgi:hypothetical protein
MFSTHEGKLFFLFGSRDLGIIRIDQQQMPWGTVQAPAPC